MESKESTLLNYLLPLQGELTGCCSSSFRGWHLQLPPPTHLKHPATSSLKAWLSILKPLGHTLESYPLSSTFSEFTFSRGLLCHISLVSPYAAASLRPTKISPQKTFMTSVYTRSFAVQPADSLTFSHVVASFNCL